MASKSHKKEYSSINAKKHTKEVSRKEYLHQARYTLETPQCHKRYPLEHQSAPFQLVPETNQI